MSGGNPYRPRTPAGWTLRLSTAAPLGVPGAPVYRLPITASQELNISLYSESRLSLQTGFVFSLGNTANTFGKSLFPAQNPEF